MPAVTLSEQARANSDVNYTCQGNQRRANVSARPTGPGTIESPRHPNHVSHTALLETHLSWRCSVTLWHDVLMLYACLERSFQNRADTQPQLFIYNNPREKLIRLIIVECYLRPAVETRRRRPSVWIRQPEPEHAWHTCVAAGNVCSRVSIRSPAGRPRAEQNFSQHKTWRKNI